MNVSFKFPILLTASLLLASFSANAAAGDDMYTFLTDPIILGFSIGVFFVIIALLAVNKSLNTLRYLSVKQQLGEEAAAEKASRGFIESMTEPTTAEEEAALLMDHMYDGIQELDNDLPPWWKWGFYISIVYAVVYSVLYFGTNDIATGPVEYEHEMAQAEKDVATYLERVGGAIDENNVVLLVDDKDLAAGKDIYTSNCVVCHLADGGGQVGPNLTDKYWIHGGGIVEVFSTIKYGVPAKGMISWADQLGPKAMQQVASYVLSLQGTTPAVAKDPEGELWQTEGEATTPKDAQETETDTEAELPTENAENT